MERSEMEAREMEAREMREGRVRGEKGGKTYYDEVIIMLYPLDTLLNIHGAEFWEVINGCQIVTCLCILQ